MFDRITLARDLLDRRGGVLGHKGLVISPESIDEAAAAARPGAVARSRRRRSPRTCGSP